MHSAFTKTNLCCLLAQKHQWIYSQPENISRTQMNKDEKTIKTQNELWKRSRIFPSCFALIQKVGTSSFTALPFFLSVFFFGQVWICWILFYISRCEVTRNPTSVAHTITTTLTSHILHHYNHLNKKFQVKPIQMCCCVLLNELYVFTSSLEKNLCACVETQDGECHRSGTKTQIAEARNPAQSSKHENHRQKK